MDFKSVLKVAQKAWAQLNGKKQFLGWLVLFVYGGLAYMNYEIPVLKDVAIALGAVGAGHKAIKIYNGKE